MKQHYLFFSNYENDRRIPILSNPIGSNDFITSQPVYLSIDNPQSKTAAYENVQNNILTKTKQSETPYLKSFN